MIVRRLALAFVSATALSFLTGAAFASCVATVTTNCAGSAACTLITGSYTNTTNTKLKQAEITAKSSDDMKTLVAATIVFTGSKATLLDPTSNTPPSGLGPGETSTYTISTPFPLAAMSSLVRCDLESVW